MTLRTFALALLVLFLASGLAGRMDYEEAKKVELAEKVLSGRCIRTYIVRPHGDAIRCTECLYVLETGTITKEGC